MTDERMALVELLQKGDDGDFLRAVAEAVLQILVEADVEGLIGAGAGRPERSSERLNYRQRPYLWVDATHPKVRRRLHSLPRRECVSETADQLDEGHQAGKKLIGVLRAPLTAPVSVVGRVRGSVRGR